MYAMAATAASAAGKSFWETRMTDQTAASPARWAPAPDRRRFPCVLPTARRKPMCAAAIHAAGDAVPLELTEENVQRVLIDARSELLQLFDTSVGITGVAELADLDGPFIKLRLRGRFWHQRSVVLARLGNYLRKRIPEIIEVQIEDERQLDDSSTNFGLS